MELPEKPQLPVMLFPPGGTVKDLTRVSASVRMGVWRPGPLRVIFGGARPADESYRFEHRFHAAFVSIRAEKRLHGELPEWGASGSSSVETEPPVISTRLPMEVAAAGTITPSPVGPDRPRPGDRLGHFELVEYVGGGGMGRVFRALDTPWAEPSP